MADNTALTAVLSGNKPASISDIVSAIQGQYQGVTPAGQFVRTDPFLNEAAVASGAITPIPGAHGAGRYFGQGTQSVGTGTPTGTVAGIGGTGGGQGTSWFRPGNFDINTYKQIPKSPEVAQAIAAGNVYGGSDSSPVTTVESGYQTPYTPLFSDLPMWLTTGAGMLIPGAGMLLNAAEGYAQTEAANTLAKTLNDAYGVDQMPTNSPWLGALLGLINTDTGAAKAAKSLAKNFENEQNLFGYYDAALNDAIQPLVADILASNDTSLDPNQMGSLGNTIGQMINTNVANGMELDKAIEAVARDLGITPEAAQAYGQEALMTPEQQLENQVARLRALEAATNPNNPLQAVVEGITGATPASNPQALAGVLGGMNPNDPVAQQLMQQMAPTFNNDPALVQGYLMAANDPIMNQMVAAVPTSPNMTPAEMGQLANQMQAQIQQNLAAGMTPVQAVLNAAKDNGATPQKAAEAAANAAQDPIAAMAQLMSDPFTSAPTPNQMAQVAQQMANSVPNQLPTQAAPTQQSIANAMNNAIQNGQNPMTAAFNAGMAAGVPPTEAAAAAANLSPDPIEALANMLPQAQQIQNVMQSVPQDPNKTPQEQQQAIVEAMQQARESGGDPNKAAFDAARAMGATPSVVAAQIANETDDPIGVLGTLMASLPDAPPAVAQNQPSYTVGSDGNYHWSNGNVTDRETGTIMGGVLTDSWGTPVQDGFGGVVGWGVGYSQNYVGSGSGSSASYDYSGAADTGMATNNAGQTVSNDASIAMQNDQFFGGTDAGSGGGYDYSGAGDTGMATNDAGQTVSNDASIAAQDAASFGDSGGGGGGGGSSRYCCSRMVHHGLWDVNHEFARLTVWSRKQPRWWRSGYPVWGKIIAKHLLGKVGFWTDVMQAFYDNKVRNKPRTWKSTLGELVIFPGAFVCGMIWREVPKGARLADPKEFA
jgi:hypothetical protein